jgi:hypothetical protein
VTRSSTSVTRVDVRAVAVSWNFIALSGHPRHGGLDNSGAGPCDDRHGETHCRRLLAGEVLLWQFSGRIPARASAARLCAQWHAS